MSRNDGSSLPRSMRQRQILDVAETNPGRSVAELAELVPTATPELVERVLDEHGDPAVDDEQANTEEHMSSPDETPTHDSVPEPVDTVDEQTGHPEETDSDAGSPGAAEARPDLADLPGKQRAVLEAVASNPEATQQEIGRDLDVSGATVSNRLNSIAGFEWTERSSFVEDLFDEGSEEPTGGGAETDAGEQPDPDGAETDPTAADADGRLQQLQARVAALERAREESSSGGESALDDPELLHKVVHACMESDAVSESEELRILRALLA